MDKYDVLKLENQLCFPLYAAAKEVVRRYKPFLDELGLTYTQYIVMMALWEEDGLSVKKVGEKVFLDSGTLTPLLKKMEAEGLVVRKRCNEDERCVLLYLTETGRQLREKAVEVPAQIGACIPLSGEEAGVLYALLYKLLNQQETE